MNWLPTDFISFIWGLIIAALAIIGTGFLREMGKELWFAFKRRINPPPPEPILVDLRFEAKLYQPGETIWVKKESLYRFEEQGYLYYPHPKSGGKCYRETGGTQEYLMVKPGAQKHN